MMTREQLEEITDRLDTIILLLAPPVYWDVMRLNGDKEENVTVLHDAINKHGAETVQAMIDRIKAGWRQHES